MATGARTTPGLLVGICVWQRPGTYPLPVGRQVREMGGSVRALDPPTGVTGQGAPLHAGHREGAPRDEHWYLCLLAADPMTWRRGIGTALLGAVAGPIDEDGLSCYLETQKEDNLAYYRRFGFEETERLTPAAAGRRCSP